MVQVHAVSAQSTMAAVEAGVPLLVHTTNKNFLTRENAQKMAASGVKVLTTVGLRIAGVRRLCRRQRSQISGRRRHGRTLFL